MTDYYKLTNVSISGCILIFMYCFDIKFEDFEFICINITKKGLQKFFF